MAKLNGIYLNKNIASLNYGGKANKILFLMQKKYKIPKSIFYSCENIEKFLSIHILNFKEKINTIALCFMHSNVEPNELVLLRNEILNLKCPLNWLQEYKKIKKYLGNRVIIRSSMNLEDTETDSFAGCFDSHQMNEFTELSLWETIKKVILSALSGSSVMRILETTTKFTDIEFGFFIQQFITPKVFGVCFSRNPLNIWEEKGVCEYGLNGNSVVQGTGVTKSLFCTDTPDQSVSPFWYELWNHAYTLEKHLCAPIDYEWVWDGCEFWIVQVRKVTTEDSFMWQKTLSGQIWSRELTQERFPEPLTPLAWTSIADIFVSNVRILNERFGIIVKNINEIGVCFGGYVYANPSVFKFPKGINIRWSHYLSIWKLLFWKLLVTFIVFFIKIIFTSFKKIEFLMFKLNLILLLFEKNYKKEFSSWQQQQKLYISRLAIFAENISTKNEMSNLELLENLEKLKTIGENFLESDFAIFLMKDTIEKNLKKVFNIIGITDLEYSAVLDNFSENKTLEFSSDCKALVKILAKDINGISFLEQLEKINNHNEFESIFKILSERSRSFWVTFMQKNGHIRTSWDFIKPSIKEAPWDLAATLRKYQTTDSVSNHTKNESSLILKKMQQKFIEVKKEKLFSEVEKALSILKELMRIDEEQHFLSGIMIEQSKNILKKVELYFIRRNVLFDENSIYFLSINEIKEQLHQCKSNLHFLTLKRKKIWEQNHLQQAPMEIPVKVKQFKLITPELDKNNLVVGQPMSPGEAQGVVFFAEHLHETSLLPMGAILVTTSPNPTLAALYPLLSGIVTVTGGILSHGFIAAREFGLPAVSGVSQAFSKLKQGMIVKINGNIGTVEIINTNSVTI